MNDTFATSRISWVLTDDDVEHLIHMLDSADVIVYDLETTGLDEHAVTGGESNDGVAARISMASFTIPSYDEDGNLIGEPLTALFPLSHPEGPWQGHWKKLTTRLAEVMQGKRLVGHNVKFDNRWMYATTGIDLSSSTHWDTQISSHLLDETTSTKLEERASDTFGIDRWGDVDLTYAGASEDEPLFKLGEYAARDSYWTWKLYENHRARMTPDPDEDLFGEEIEEARLGDLARWCAMPTTATLTAIEQRGLVLDDEWVRERIQIEEATRDQTREDLVSRYLDDDLDPEKPSFAPTSHWFQKWTELAVENGDLRVAALTPTGKAQWSKAVLARQARGGSEVAQILLDHRDAAKRLEFLRSWMSFQTTDHRIHSTYHAGSVVSGRLSSSGPNMQQVTRALRPAFVPSPGYVLVDLDYSQIELRVAAFISQSEPMIEAYQYGDDLHSIMAANISGKTVDEVTKDERQRGKAANFGLLYGMGAMGFKEYAETAYGVHFSEQESAQVHETFFNTWRGLRAWHARTVTRAHETGQAVSPLGRVRRLPMIWDGNERMVGFAERAAINSPVQGMASDIMQIAASSIEGNIPISEPVRRARLVGTVHDSILVEVPEDDWQEVGNECRLVMEAEVPRVLRKMGCDFTVPLKADGVVGTRWGISDVGEL